MAVKPVSEMTKKELKEAYQEICDFIDDENSSIGHSDFMYQSELIREIAKRGLTVVEHKKDSYYTLKKAKERKK